MKKTLSFKNFMWYLSKTRMRLYKILKIQTNKRG